MLGSGPAGRQGLRIAEFEKEKQGDAERGRGAAAELLSLNGLETEPVSKVTCGEVFVS
jgi:hypothetical protein